jgi:hypothetical protein
LPCYVHEFAGAAQPAEAPAARTRHVIVSSIVDIEAIGPDDSHRITTLVMAGLNARRGEGDYPRVDSVYDPGRGHLRVMITAGPALACELVRTIGALAEVRRD